MNRKNLQLAWWLLFNHKKYESHLQQIIKSERMDAIESAMMIAQGKLEMILNQKEKFITKNFQNPILVIPVSSTEFLSPMKQFETMQRHEFATKEFRKNNVHCEFQIDPYMSTQVSQEEIKQRCARQIASYLVDNDFLSFKPIDLGYQKFIQVSINAYE